MIVCCYEDRLSNLIGLKLLILSLRRHCGDIPIALRVPNADETFRQWAARIPHVELNTAPLSSSGWNVYPTVLLEHLNNGHDQVVWIDSDIIVMGDFRREFREVSDDALIVAEESLGFLYADDDAFRAKAWGFVPGRTFPYSLNTCVTRVTREHRPLLLSWQELLTDERYIKAQSGPWEERPKHLFGDQDVLMALVTSEQFRDVPIKFLERGTDIVQYLGLDGYTCAERMRHLIGGLPKFLHVPGLKPWVQWPRRSTGHAWHDVLWERYRELSPYVLEAAHYRSEIEDECPWLDASFKSSAVLRALGGWHPPLVGLPIAVAMDARRMRRRLLDGLKLSL